MPNYCCNYNTCFSSCTCSACFPPQEDRTLASLQNTNHDLKHLINKLDHLSDSIDMSISQRSHISRHFEHANPIIVQNHYIVKQRSASPKYYCQCNKRSCSSCEHINYLRELEHIKKDQNIYPLEHYRRESIHYDNCDDCGNGRCRSRSRNRSWDEQTTTTTYTMNVIKPKWNGGPYASSYNWRDDKLKGSGL